MGGNTSQRRMFFVLGLLMVGALAVACAGGATGPSATPTSTTTPQAAQPATPTAATTPSTTQPAQQQQPAVTGEAAIGRGLTALAQSHLEGQPLVPGGPPFYPRALLKEKGFQLHDQYHITRQPLWTKAFYGGEQRFAGSWTPAQYTQVLRALHLSRPSYSGMLLLFDMGRCSLVDRQGSFDTCKGQYGNNQSIKIIPGVFERWAQPDPLTYVFTVRKGVLWPVSPVMKRTDREVTAQDIVTFLEITKKEGVLRDNFQLVDRIEAVDRYTVRVSMKLPHAEFIRHMGNSSMGIFPPECFEAKDCLGGNYSFSPGPFLIKQHEPRQWVVFEKNTEFYLKGLPYLDLWRVDVITDPQAQKAAFVTRKTDQFSAGSVLEVEGLKKQAPDAQVISAWVIAGTVALRPQLVGPLADIRVRKALTMTMNLPQVWEAGTGGHTAFPYLVSHDTFGSEWYYSLEQAGPNYQFNPEKAKQLLKEAGYPNGFTIPLTTYLTSGSWNDMAITIQANWKRYLNVDLQFKVVDFASYSQSQTEKTWDGILQQLAWNIMWWGDQEMAIGHFTKGQFLNLQNVDDPVAVDLFPKVRSELDPAKRTAMLWQWEQHEREMLYTLRVAILTNFHLIQPWELNGAPHEVAWFSSINGPTWMGMHDTTKEPKR